MFCAKDTVKLLNRYINGELQKKDRLYWDIKAVYYAFMCVGGILIIVALLLSVISNNVANDPAITQLVLQLQSLHFA